MSDEIEWLPVDKMEKLVVVPDKTFPITIAVGDFHMTLYSNGSYDYRGNLEEEMAAMADSRADASKAVLLWLILREMRK